MRQSGEQPKSKPTMATEKIKYKEIRTELLTAPVMEEKIYKISESLLKPQDVGTKTGGSKKKISEAEGCVNKEDADWYQKNVNDVLDQLIKDLLQDEDEKLHTLIEKFVLEVHKSIQHINLQPGIELVEMQDIVDTIADKDGTPLKLFLRGELVLNKDVWQKLIDLKFGITVN